MARARSIRRGLLGLLFAASVACGVVFEGCSRRGDRTAPLVAPLHLTSGAFTAGSALPPQFTCDGLNFSPPLSWDNPHRQAIESYTIMLDDADAPRSGFTHWILFNVSPSLSEVPGGLSQELTLPRLGATHGRNDFGKIGYSGPCPRKGQTHRYVFHVFALDTRIPLGPGVARAAIDGAMRGHILAAGMLNSTYAR